MTRSDITITRRSGDHAEIITVAGDIDIATYGQLRAALIKAVDEGAGSVIVDMEGVEWIDSTRLGTPVGALKRARDRHGTVHVAAAPGRIAKHFQVTGLARLFGMHATVEAALAITAETGSRHERRRDGAWEARLCVAYMRLVRHAVRFGVLPPSWATRMTAPFYQAAADAGLRLERAP